MFLLLLGAIIGILVVESSLLILAIAFAAFLALMLSFAVTSQMLRQIDAGHRPSILAALFTVFTTRVFPRVFGLTVVWFAVVAVLVAVEAALRAALARVSEDLADSAANAIFGTLADALRMSAFMVVAIMTFEDQGLGPAFGRLRAILANNPIAAVGGLVLTKLVSVLAAVSFYVLADVAGVFILVPIAGFWLLGIYLEQIFVTGVYLYSTRPDSRLVGILLEEVVGRELPEVHTGMRQQPAT